jgi:hypothetical protein
LTFVLCDAILKLSGLRPGKGGAVMALIRFGGGVVQMSGSIAGDTFARNRYGNYSRARTKPVNPNSDRQVVVRARIAVLAEYWNDTLTAAQRTAWGSYAAAVPWTNKLGETIHLSGFNMFVRSNAVVLEAGDAIVAAGPTLMQLPPQDSGFSVALSEASGITVTFTDTLDWCDEDGGHMALDIGTPQNASRTFFNGPWRHHDCIDGDSVTPPSSPDGPTAVSCWTLTEGQRVWVRARIVREDGRLSNIFTAASVLVAA